MKPPIIEIPIAASEFGAAVWDVLLVSAWLMYRGVTAEAAASGSLLTTAKRRELVELAFETAVADLSSAHPFREPILRYLREYAIPRLDREPSPPDLRLVP